MDNNKTTIKKRQLTADDIEKLNLNQQKKLTELGAQLALKKKEEDDKLKKYDELKNYLNDKYKDSSDTFTFNDETKKIKKFLELNEFYFNKLKKEKEELKEDKKTLDEELENSIQELEDFEKATKDKDLKWSKRVVNLREKCIYKNKVIFYLQITLILLNLITYDITLNGYNSYFICGILLIISSIYNFIIYLLTNVLESIYYLTDNLMMFVVFSLTYLMNLLLELFYKMMSYVYPTDDL